MFKIFFKKVDTDNWYEDDNLFIMGNRVYRSLHHTYESQSSVIGFENFIEECPDIIFDFSDLST